MTAIVRIIAVVGVLLSLSGCSSRFNYVGTWVGRQNVSGQPGADPVIVNTFAQTKLTIKDNGRFELYYLGLPRSGAVDYRDGSATLTVKEIMNKPAEAAAEIVLTPNSQGELELRDQANLGEQVVILRRESQP